jgi:tripeptidyl-peptidase-1
VSVGGTQGTDEEVVCQGNMYGAITSGGGFSGYYPQPAYQRANVSAYFEQATPYSDPSRPFQSFNKSNRGYPDVSAQAAFYSFMYYSTIQIAFAGTSAATPVTAAMFSLINAARNQTGQSPLGFVQPLLYSQGSAFFKDIVSGNNSCLANFEGLEAECCPVQGFTAQPGWDPATGLGTINFQRFYDTLVGGPTNNDDDDSNAVTAGQRAAVGISIAVISVMFVGALLFVLQVPVPSWWPQCLRSK